MSEPATCKFTKCHIQQKYEIDIMLIELKERKYTSCLVDDVIGLRRFMKNIFKIVVNSLYIC